ncbi:hypothetical protein [Kiloniella antarctica]|uniref:H repeat-associated protein N-terminal domain-containing protein n=1 Tax=Kiloniella antarctica TaxID=1550907 RepID=A0ABW5BFT1_9PROT
MLLVLHSSGKESRDKTIYKLLLPTHKRPNYRRLISLLLIVVSSLASE